MKRATTILALAALAAWATPLSAQEPTAVGPAIYKVVLDNARVRVMEATFKPGERIGAHSHPDHFGYVLEGGSLTITPAGGKPQVHDLKPGAVVWIPAETHSAENSGKTTVKVLVVEIKDAAKK